MCTLKKKKVTARLWRSIICSPQLLASDARKVVDLSLNDGKDQLSQKTLTTVYFGSPFPQNAVQVLFFLRRDMQSMPRSARATLKRLIHSVSLAVNLAQIAEMPVVAVVALPTCKARRSVEARGRRNQRSKHLHK